MAEQDSPGIGHNRSFLELYKEHNAALPDYLASEHADIAARARELKEEFELAPTDILDDEAEKVATEFGGRLAKFVKMAEAQRTIDKAPTLQASRIVDNFFIELSGGIDSCLKMLSKRVNAYKDEKAKAARAAKEEEQRKAAAARDEAERLKRLAKEEQDAAVRKAMESDAKQAETTAKVAERTAAAAPVTTARGDNGTSSVQSKRWTGEITDLETLDLLELRPYIATAALESAVRQYAVKHKDTRPLAGARCFEFSSTSFRA